jgi:hypothetical protein
MCQWLGCNDIDSLDVPFKSDVFVESVDGEKWVIRHSVYVSSADGVPRYDAVTGSYSYGERILPLLNDPPMWWLREVEINH